MPPVERTTRCGASGSGNGSGSGSPPVERTTRCGASGAAGASVSVATAGAGAPSSSGALACLGAAFAVDFFAVDFLGLGGSGSSTIGSRRIPFESARRRTRSAIGSSMLEEWLLTPILSSVVSSSTSSFEMPSSRASS